MIRKLKNLSKYLTQNGYSPLIAHYIQQAATQNKTLVLAGHGIFTGKPSKTPKWSVNVEDLYHVVTKIKEAQLTSHTYRDTLEVEELVYTSSFNEEHYLAKHNDVKWAVENKMMTSGEDHFNMFGKKEGREYSLIFKSK